MKRILALLLAGLIAYPSCVRSSVGDNEVVYKVTPTDTSYDIEVIGQESKTTRPVFVFPDLSGKDFADFLHSRLIQDLASRGVTVQIVWGDSLGTEENLGRATYIESISPRRVSSGDVLVIKIMNHGYAN